MASDLDPAEPPDTDHNGDGLGAAMTSTQAARHQIALALATILATDQFSGPDGLGHALMLQAAQRRLLDIRAGLHAVEGLLAVHLKLLPLSTDHPPKPTSRCSP